MSFLSRLAVANYNALRHCPKLLVYAILLLFWGISIFIVRHIQVNNNSSVFFPDSSPTLQRMARGMDLAPFSRFVCVDFAIENTDDESLQNLAQSMKQFERKLSSELVTPFSTNQYIERITPEHLLALLPSLFTEDVENEVLERISEDNIKQSVQKSYGLLTGFSVAAMIPWLRTDPLSLRDFVLEHFPKQSGIPTAEARYGYPLSADGKHMLLLLKPKKSMHDTEFAVQLMQNIESASRHLPPEAIMTVLGGIRHTAANTQTINEDIQWIASFSLLGLALVYLLFVRSLGAIWLLLLPFFTVSFALLCMHILFGAFSGLAIGFGAAVLGIAEGYAIHMHFALRSEQHTQKVLAILSTPLLQGLILNITGFSLLLLSSIPAVRQIAIFSIVTLLLGFILALFVFPLFHFFNMPKLQDAVHYRKPRKPILARVLILFTFLCMSCFFLFSTSKIDVSPRSMGADMQSIQIDAENFANTWHMNESSLILVEVHNSENSLIKNSNLLESLRTTWPHAQLTSIADIVPSSEKAQKNCARWSSFIAQHYDEIKEYFAQAEKKLGLQQTLFKPFFDVIAQKAQPITLDYLEKLGFTEIISHFVRDFPSDGVAQSLIISDKHLDLSKLPHHVLDGVVELEPQTLEIELKKLFTREASYLPFALLVYLCVLLVCFKNLGQALLAAIAPLCSFVCIFTALTVFGHPLSLASLAALFLVFGLAVDHGVMVTHDMAAGVECGISRAVLVSSLTACVGMGLLAFSNHPALRDMGYVIFIGLAVEVPTSLYILPLFCKECEA